MNSDVRNILELVQAKQISPRDASRKLRESRSRAPAEPTPATPVPAAEPATEAAAAISPNRRKVAVVGLSCRFAGARSANQFWRNLAGGVCSIGEVPAERWSAEEVYDPDPSTPGKTNSRWGGFVDDVDAFDALFFNISGKEAELTDPQQRLFLEACWTALEDAGYANDAVSGRSCGVFAGAPSSDYAGAVERLGVVPDAQGLMGNDTAILPARISYFLNLKGPSLAVNTACSSSLVAIHLACQAIELGQCQMAIAGGVCLFVTPSFYISSAKAGMLSPRGRCNTFDQEADGFVPGDGVGVVVLKALDDAVRDGDHIYGVIIGSDTNQDGKTNGITAPSSLSQTAVQRSAYRKAGITPESISLIEAHGTGTKLGDPIEIDALTRSFAEHTDRTQFCAIGSVKTNIGHTGQAAGAAGLIKLLLALEHEVIPATLNFQNPNERIQFDRTPFFVARAATPWPRQPLAPRRAAVSSFGYSGTNAHLVVEEAPAPQPVAVAESDAAQLVLISAKTSDALAQRLADLHGWLEDAGRGQQIVDIAFTLHAGRKHFAERAAFVVRDAGELRRAIEQARDGARPDHARLRAADKQEWAERLRDEPRASSLSGDARRDALQRLADLYVRGLDVDVELIYPDARGRRLAMPTYPFARDRYWVGRDPDAPEPAGPSRPRHPLLMEPSSADEHRHVFRPTGSEFFATDHVIHGRAILAAAACLELARAAGERSTSRKIVEIRDVAWRRPLPCAPSTGLAVRLIPDGDDLRFEIDEDGQGRPPSAIGVLRGERAPGEDARVDLAAVRGRCARTLSGAECYEKFREIGLDYGPGFRVISELCCGDGEALARLELPEAFVAGLPDFVLHPGLLDGALQSLLGLHVPGETDRYVPYAVSLVRIHAALPRTCHAHLVRRAHDTFDIDVVDDTGCALVVIRGLVVAQTRVSTSERLWFQPVWRKVAARPSAHAPGPVLVLDVDREAAARLRAQLPGHAVTLAMMGSRFRSTGPTEFEIDPSSARDYARLLDTLGNEARPSSIVMLWSARAEAHSTTKAPDLTRGFYSLLYLSQALMRSPQRGPVRIAFVYPVRDGVAPAELAALHAFASTLRLEHPDLRLQTIGLPADGIAGSPRIAERWNDLLGGLDSGPVDIRLDDGGAWWARSLEPYPAPHDVVSRIREGGVYLITGGAGGLGLLLARRLARHRAKLILVGRSGLTREQSHEIDRLTQAGASVLYELADVSDRAALERAIQRGRTQFGAIQGVVHAAGALRDSLIFHKTADDARAVIAPKLDAALWLDQLTCEDRLDFFVMFSSVVSVLGNVGQADYAFANAFLDELAAAREVLRRDGKRHGKTLAIDWPAWAGGGMKSIEGADHHASERIEPLADEEGLDVFEQALAFDGPQLVVIKGEPAAIRRSLTSLVDTTGGHPSLVDGPSAPPPTDGASLRAAAEEHLRKILAAELRIPAARILPHEPLESFGIDSVMVMRLSRRLEQDFGPLPKTLFFEFQNLHDLSSYFAERHGDRLIQQRDSSANGAPALEARGAASPAASPAPTDRPVAQPVIEHQPDRAAAIAIVGLSGRYPMADDLETFWSNLAAGRDCITEIPPDRWELDGFYSPDRAELGKSYSKWGGFLADIDKFDPLFFNIAPREADMIDPQERLFLETAWHVLEDAGYTRNALRDVRTGVFVGVMYGQYQLLQAADGRIGLSSHASIANRVSYFCNLTGPSIAVDTMCSSSLTAIHLACESLRRGECQLAIAGGVNLTLHPRKYVQLSLGGFASSDGRCRSFGDGGDGYVPGEGVGAMLLKPLAAAIADGDAIHAIVRGSAINHGGKTNGYTVPNPHAQSASVIDALRHAKVDPTEVSYIEAHGTGTSLGDPIEIAALTRAYAEVAPHSGSCPIGSVKSAIGHLESAAGIAALTKVILQMRHRAIPPSIHAEKLNPNIDFDHSPFYVQRELVEWERPVVREAEPGSSRPRIAGVSSFGAGGSNAHVVIEEYEAPRPASLDVGPQIVIVSARTADQLAALARRLLADFERQPGSERRPWQAAFRDDLVRRVCEIAGVSQGEIDLQDRLGECGLDEMAIARLVAGIVEAYQLEGVGAPPAPGDTVEQLANALTRDHEAGLRARFGSEDSLTAASPSMELADIAYTLQVGREAMPERLAFVASDLTTAARYLRAFGSGTSPGPDCFAGRVRTDADDATVAAFEGPTGENHLRTLMRRGELARVAELWVQGAPVNWSILHEGTPRRRVSLPGYPFLRERHWLPFTDAAPLAPTPVDPPARMAAPSTEPVAAAPAGADELHPRIVADLVSLAADVVGAEPGRVDPKISVGDYGFESMTLKELAERISARYSVSFAPTVFFERSTLAGVASHLLEEHGPQLEAHYRSPESANRAVSVPVARPIQPGPLPSSGKSPATRDPIAIIGMSGQFPGSKDLGEYWDNLRSERNLITEIPTQRWDWHEFDHDGLPADQRCKSHWGGFIDDVDTFDPLFFGISPAEAEMMDPQQRLFLQSVWAAIEDAGYRASELSGKNVGLFAGVQFSDYQHLLHEAGVLTAQSGIGNEHSIVLNRISYLLNLRGPSEPVNTACSSSLVAVHRAVQSIRTGESDVAIAGGIALNLAPHSMVAAGLMGLLAPDGKCKTLARGANGYVKGEGIGVIVLKPLDRALADGDHVHALIRGTAVNHGGRATSLTAPNAEAQSALVQAAIEDAAIDPATIGYIELHGTGTELGDPVEINGLKSAFRQLAKKRGAPAPTQAHCGIGSVKTNIGHLEPASGIAGLMKVILGMRHQTMAGMLHLEQVNPYIDLTNSPFFITDKTRPWEPLRDDAGERLPLRAGVSSFGFGGVNAHAIIEEYVEPAAADTGSSPRDQIFVLSAKTDAALQESVNALIARLDAWQRDGAGVDPADVASTLQTGREEMTERLACVAGNLAELRERLERFVKQEPGVEHVHRGSATAAPAAATAERDAQDLDGVAERWVQGGAVDWGTVQHGARRRRVSLPSYPFAKKRFWFTAPAGQAPRRAATPAAAAGTTGADDESLTGEEYVRDRLAQILIQKLKLEDNDLDEDRNLQDYGADSMLSAMIMQAVQEEFGSQVPLTAVADHPTLRSLATYIHEECFSGEAIEPVRPKKSRARDGETARGKGPVRLPPELLPINMKGSRQPSFWVHGATGYSIWFKNLSDALGPEYPMYAFQARGTDGQSMPQTLEEMVDHYIHCIRVVQPQGPYFVGGYSFGGLIAMEMARKLHEQGETIKHLVMFDTYPATQEVFQRHFGPYDHDFLPLYLVNFFLKITDNPELAVHKSDIANIPPQLQLHKLATMAKERGNKRMAIDEIFNYLRGGLLCSEYSEGMYQTYTPRPYDASDVLFFRALDGFTGRATMAYWPPTNILDGYDYTQPWRDLVKHDFQVCELDNDHLNMLEEPTLALATQRIEALLKQPPPIDMAEYDRFEEGFGDVTRFGQDLLARRFRDADVLPPADQPISLAELQAKLKVLPQYDRLFRASMDLLERSGYVRREGDGVAAGADLAKLTTSDAEITARADSIAAARPEAKDYIPLLVASQAAVLEVMDGSRDPMDVLFPGGSGHLVAELYKGNLQTDFYNKLVADHVFDHVGRRARQYKHANIQIFEVGAGTGSTSVFVLDALKDLAKRVRYFFTDIGSGFVQMSRAQLAAKYPFVEFLVFDVEKPPEKQGFEPSTMDVVIASNVLHATRRIAVTLEQCRRLLKTSGTLVINELTQRLDYNTLTFGLTTGWWLYDDEDIRISGCPLLTGNTWTRMLEGAGFCDVAIAGVPGVSPAELPQSIITARAV